MWTPAATWLPLSPGRPKTPERDVVATTNRPKAMKIRRAPKIARQKTGTAKTLRNPATKSNNENEPRARMEKKMRARLFLSFV